MKSCVRNQSYMSDWFDVSQGTRQGGKSSPLLYLLFIDGLIRDLEHSNDGICVFNLKAGSPTVADDMVLVSFSKHGLDRMLNTCHTYAMKWRYEYNPSKCAVIVFNESNADFRKTHRQWKLGNKPLAEVEQYTHLGIVCDKFMNIESSVKDSYNKLRGTFLGIVNSGIHPNGLNPLTSVTIYKSVVLPKALYGCELWNSLTLGDLNMLERGHRFCIVFIQNIPIYTKTDIALHNIGITSIEAEITYKKLQFFSQLCRLPCKHIAKQIFVNRLLRYLNNDNQTRGFIPDLYRLLIKYDLLHYLEGFISYSTFPSKFTWKRILKSKVLERESRNMSSRLTAVMSAEHISHIFDGHGPCRIWQLLRKHPAMRRQYQTTVWVLSKLFSFCRSEICTKCNNQVNNRVVHTIQFCPVNTFYRKQLWNAILKYGGIRVYCKFISNDSSVQICDLLAGLANYIGADSEKLYITIINLIYKMFQISE